MRADLRELWQFRELLLSLVERDLRIRYKNSLLGFLWSLLNPLITVMVMTVVFKFALENDTPNFSAYILAAYLPYLFFQMSVLDSAQSVLTALPIVKKVYFPREILPLASILSNFIHLVLALGVYFAYMLVVYWLDPRVWPFTWNSLLLPVLLCINLALAAGTGLIVSALNTFYEDVKYIVSVLLYLMFFICPIMYFSENIRYSQSLQGPYGDLIYTLYHLNPVAMLVTSYRKALVAPQQVMVNGNYVDSLPLDWGLLAACAGISFGLLAFGYRLFCNVKWRFVERP